MAYVIYHVATTAILNGRSQQNTSIKYYKTAGAAKTAMARLVNRCNYSAESVAVADLKIYQTLIERTVERVNLMTGQRYRESVNTPNHCSPASEAYWSM